MALATTAKKAAGSAEKAKVPPSTPAKAAPAKAAAPTAPAAPAKAAAAPTTPQGAPPAGTAPPPAATPPAAAGGAGSAPAGSWTFSTWWAYARPKYLNYLVGEDIPVSKVLFAYNDEATEKKIPKQVAVQVWNGIVELQKAATAPKPPPATIPGLVASSPAAAPPATPAAVPTGIEETRKPDTPATGGQGGALPGLEPPTPKVELPAAVISPPPTSGAAAPAGTPPAEETRTTTTAEEPFSIEILPEPTVKGKTVSRRFDDPLQEREPPVGTPRSEPPATRPPTEPAGGSSTSSTSSGSLGHPLDEPNGDTGAPKPGQFAFKVNGVPVFVKPKTEGVIYYLFRVSKTSRAVVLQDPRDGSFRAATFADIAVWGVMMGDPRPNGAYEMRAPTPAELEVIAAEFNQGQTENDAAAAAARQKANPLLLLAGLYLAMRG